MSSSEGGNTRFREWRRSVLAGAGAGGMTSLVTCPMDVVKTRLQSQSIPRGSSSVSPAMGILFQSFGFGLNGNGRKNGYLHEPYKGTVPSLRRIFREEGIRGLYRGLTPTIIGYLPAHAIYFSVYSTCKSIFWEGGGAKSHVVAALCGGAAAATATNPLWVIRTRLMTQARGRTPYFYHGTLDAAQRIIKEEGIRGLYKGLGPSLLGLLHVCVQFPLYERIKLALKAKHHDQRADKPHFMDVLIASTASKVTASLATYPHEVLRTRLQSQTESGEKRYKGVVQGARRIWAEEGPFGFYRGLSTAILRVVPASAVTLLTFEALMAYIP